MATTKQVYRTIFILALIGIGLFIAWYVFFRFPGCDPSRPGYDKKGRPSDKCKAKEPPKTEVAPSGSSWIPEAFPLRKGMWGDKIKLVQQALKIPDDGKFGNQTEGAVVKKINKTEVSEADYKLIVPQNDKDTTISPSTTTKKVYSIAAATGVYDDVSDYIPYRLAGADEYLGEYAGTKKDYWGTAYVKIKQKPNDIIRYAKLSQVYFK